MQMQIKLGDSFNRTVDDLGSLGGRVTKAAYDGLAEGGQIAAGNVISKHLSGQSLKRRTGQLAAHVTSWSQTPSHIVIGVKDGTPVDRYKWLLTDDEKTIVPTNSKFPPIPICENLTGSGVARFSSPRQVPDGFFVKTKGKLLFGYKKGKRGKFRPLFVLVKSVFVQGSGALYDGVEGSIDDINDAIQDRINTAIGA